MDSYLDVMVGATAETLTAPVADSHFADLNSAAVLNFVADSNSARPLLLCLLLQRRCLLFMSLTLLRRLVFPLRRILLCCTLLSLLGCVFLSLISRILLRWFDRLIRFALLGTLRAIFCIVLSLSGRLVTQILRFIRSPRRASIGFFGCSARFRHRAGRRHWTLG